MERISKADIFNVPRGFYTLHQFVTLAADVMFVNSAPFLVTFSRKVRLRTAEHIPNRMAKQLGNSLYKFVNMYPRGVFLVNIILVDQEFDKVKE